MLSKLLSDENLEPKLLCPKRDLFQKVKWSCQKKQFTKLLISEFLNMKYNLSYYMRKEKSTLNYIENVKQVDKVCIHIEKSLRYQKL